MNDYISINGQRIDLTEEQVANIRRSLIPEIKLGDVPPMRTCKIGDHEMIVLEHILGTTLLLRKDLLKDLQRFGKSNMYVDSDVDVLCQKFGVEIAAVVGKENVVLHEVDLTADDGLKDYGSVDRYASLLTADQARRYVEILDKYKIEEYWWLATSYSTPAHGGESWVKCVSPSGRIYGVNYYCGFGVRPFCILNSNIFVSQ